MRKGELFISVTGGSALQSSSIPFGFPTASPLGMPTGQTVTEDGPLWRERTERKKGWLVKKEETQTLKISGSRCAACGYIELYVSK